MTQDATLDAAFAALAHPARRAMLARLAQTEATVNELAEPLNISLPAVSKHIKVLENAGLITRGRNAQFRPCRLAPGPLREVAAWTDQYRHIWDARFDDMARVLKDMQGDDHHE